MCKSDAERLLVELVRSGGPSPNQYSDTLAAFQSLADNSIPTVTIRRILQPVLTRDTMHGFAILRPHGYAGDFEIIDRIYTRWMSPHPLHVKWDEFFHAQHALNAVRNRKDYFIDCVAAAARRNLLIHTFRVLNVGSGPARDVFEFFTRQSGRQLTTIDCVDVDERAIAYASGLCHQFLDRVKFSKQNVIRLKMDGCYDLIWSAGVFDYLSDRLFVLALRRLSAHLDVGGELVIGNFSPTNPSRRWMESLGDWRLEHRSADQLLALAKGAGIRKGDASVRSESLGVNLFLHVTKD